MTPQEQRIAIAEACGWKITRQQYSSSTNEFWALMKGDKCFSSGARARLDEPDIFTLQDYVTRFQEKNLLPNYTEDLNAMYEAEIACIHSQGKGMVYGKYLRQVCDKMPKIEYHGVVYQQWDFSATAAQRAEAFLRTLGKID